LEYLIDRLKDYLGGCQGRIVNLKDIRVVLEIKPGSKEDTLLRSHMSKTLVVERIVVPSGRNDGFYKVVKQAHPVRVFMPNRERSPVFDLLWPVDRKRDCEMEIGEAIVVREGDLITIGGVKSKGKTALCLNIIARNIDKSPVLMGNEYTILSGGKFEPAPRFLNRLDAMSSWVSWVNDEGYDKFVLLPVREDYAEHIYRDRINVIDWINLDGDRSYDISKVLESIKAAVGRGVGIAVTQKGEGTVNARGGQFVRDFSDVEILLDGYGDYDDDVLLTVKGCKEKTSPIVGRTYAYRLVNQGTEIWDFREVKKCPQCRGTGYTRGGTCDGCSGRKFVDKEKLL